VGGQYLLPRLLGLFTEHCGIPSSHQNSDSCSGDLVEMGRS
jgi:hypothetical protein